ncbi:helix-turn-helix domain-containing protein [Chloroflexota bacterium]
MQTVCLWRKRYAEYVIKGLKDQPKSGRPRTIDRDEIAEIVATTIGATRGCDSLERSPTGQTGWG